ncbi:MAG: hypothetical protein MR970_08165 [Spirochaetia bacterium]|nr:hypothetical protein [Spirochaetia bacterium]MDD7699172.1 hypothetical protein [Spirochaetia bacterium]MDY4212032.1 hypothetical protein [Treponema sp.]
MKTFFSVLISYFVLFILGTLLSSSLVMIYIGCLKYVVGQQLNLFSVQDFLLGLDYSFVLIVILLPMFLILSLIRHSKKNRLIGIITTVVLTAVSWGVLLPVFFEYEKKNSFSYELKKSNLSSKIFRFSGSRLFYYTNVDAENNADGIMIDMNKQFSAEDSFSAFENKPAEIPGSSNFSDILVKRVAEIPKFLKICFADLYIVINAAKKSFLNSKLNYLFFCSFALALVFVFALIKVSKWRLINAFFVLLSTVLLIKINSICYGIVLYKEHFGFLYDLNDKLKNAGSVFNYMDSPVCVFINVLFVLVFIIIALTCKVMSHSKLEDEGE